MHASVKLMLRSPQMRAKIGQALASKGRGGDTMIAHINPQEAAMLKARGGSGTINPKTGLPEFMLSGPGTAGNSAIGSGGQVSGIGGGNRGGGNGGGGVQGNAPVSEQQAQTRANYARAQADYSNTGNTGLQNAGNALARALGVGEIDPRSQGMGHFAPGLSGVPGQNQADWGGDYGGAIAGLLGGAVGFPLGLAYKAGKWTGAIPRGFGVANLGPDVFGGGPSSSGGGFLGGGGWGGGSPGSVVGAGSNGPGGNGQYASGGPAMGASPAGTAAPTMQGYLQALQSGSVAPGATFQSWAAAQERPATTPAPVPTAPASSGLVPLMSQAPMTADAFGGRFGAIPTWATNPYQLGIAPTNFAVPRV
jgi:hypothetical protein